MVIPRKLAIGALLVVVACPMPAAARIFDEFRGSRSAAMGGAHRGVGTSNDTLYMNPAGMAIMRRYSIEGHYGYSPFDRLSRINVSALDSQSGPVAGAIAYTHDRGDKDGIDAAVHRFYFGTAYALGQHLAFGFSTKYLRGGFSEGEERQDLSAFTADVGLMAHYGGFGLGVAYNNMIKSDVPNLLPPTLGTGLSFTTTFLTLAADATFDFSPEESFLVNYHAGIEYFAGGAFPLRLGYIRQSFMPTADATVVDNRITAGVGWISQTIGIDLSYQHSVNQPKNWGLVAGLKIFLR